MRKASAQAHHTSRALRKRAELPRGRARPGAHAPGRTVVGGITDKAFAPLQRSAVCGDAARDLVQEELDALR
ncbi:hypothetical protein ACIQXD_16495 [Streptomyces uncialis]|uniref:hypothetical protein n=1 Tax=Streptomyces uncialis TaxID=1048205 RepID=UPI0037F40DDB